MPTSLPDHATTRRPQPSADVTRRNVLHLFLPLAAAPFTVLPLDVAMWLRCGRQTRPA